MNPLSKSDASEISDASEPGVELPPSSPGICSLLTVAVVIGLWAALIGSLLLTQTRSYFSVPPLPPELAAQVEPFQPIPPEVNDAVNRLERTTTFQNTALSLAVLGLVTLPLVGGLGGYIFRGGSGLLAGGVAGFGLAIPIGGLAGVGAVFVIAMTRRASPEIDSLVLMTVTHAILWFVFSLGTVTTLAAATQSKIPLLRTLAAVFVGAAATSVIYQIAAMFMSPLAQSEILLPEGVVLNGLFAGLGVAITTSAAFHGAFRATHPSSRETIPAPA